LAKLFVDVFTGAQIRVGSVILLNSVAHLAAVGTAAYAESFVRAAKYIMTSFGGKVSVRMGVPVLLGGAADSAVVRSLLEVAAWVDGLTATKDDFLRNTRDAFRLCLKNSGIGQAVQAEKLVLQLPVNLLTFEKKRL
jgi:hypothetical protein